MTDEEKAMNRWFALEKRCYAPGIEGLGALNQLISAFRWYRQEVDKALKARWGGTIDGPTASALESALVEALEIHTLEEDGDG